MRPVRGIGARHIARADHALRRPRIVERVETVAHLRVVGCPCVRNLGGIQAIGIKAQPHAPCFFHVGRSGTERGHGGARDRRSREHTTEHAFGRTQHPVDVLHLQQRRLHFLGLVAICRRELPAFGREWLGGERPRRLVAAGRVQAGKLEGVVAHRRAVGRGQHVPAEYIIDHPVAIVILPVAGNLARVLPQCADQARVRGVYAAVHHGHDHPPPWLTRHEQLPDGPLRPHAHHLVGVIVEALPVGARRVGRHRRRRWRGNLNGGLQHRLHGRPGCRGDDGASAGAESEYDRQRERKQRRTLHWQREAVRWLAGRFASQMSFLNLHLYTQNRQCFVSSTPGSIACAP